MHIVACTQTTHTVGLAGLFIVGGLKRLMNEVCVAVCLYPCVDSKNNSVVKPQLSGVFYSKYDLQKLICQGIIISKTFDSILLFIPFIYSFYLQRGRL